MPPSLIVQENVKKRKAAAGQRFQNFLAGQRMTAGNIVKFGQSFLDKSIMDYRSEMEGRSLLNCKSSTSKDFSNTS